MPLDSRARRLGRARLAGAHAAPPVRSGEAGEGAAAAGLHARVAARPVERPHGGSDRACGAQCGARLQRVGGGGQPVKARLRLGRPGVGERGLGQPSQLVGDRSGTAHLHSRPGEGAGAGEGES